MNDAPKLRWREDAEGEWGGYAGKSLVATICADAPMGVEWTAMPRLNAVGALASDLLAAQSAAEEAWTTWFYGLFDEPRITPPSQDGREAVRDGL